jgi:hypothetical protein
MIKSGRMTKAPGFHVVKLNFAIKSEFISLAASFKPIFVSRAWAYPCGAEVGNFKVHPANSRLY